MISFDLRCESVTYDYVINYYNEFHVITGYIRQYQFKYGHVGLKLVTKIYIWLCHGYNGLHKVTIGYNWLQRVTYGYNGLHIVTMGYM